MAFVKSTEAHAEIISVDTTEALGMPGIHGYINYRDMKKNELQLYIVLAENKVRICSYNKFPQIIEYEKFQLI